LLSVFIKPPKGKNIELLLFLKVTPLSEAYLSQFIYNSYNSASVGILQLDPNNLVAISYLVPPI
jgi:hypothetical protein